MGVLALFPPKTAKSTLNYNGRPEEEKNNELKGGIEAPRGEGGKVKRRP